MKTQGTPDSACRISEKNFWSALRGPTEAIEFGLAGKKAAAYRKLGEYLADELAADWDGFRAKAEPHPPTDKAVSDVLRGRFASYSYTFDLGEKIDFTSDAIPADAGFFYMGWMGPVIGRVMLTGGQHERAWLIDTFNRLYAARDRLRSSLGHPIFDDMLAMSGLPETYLRIYLGLLHSGGMPTKTAEALLKLTLGVGRALHARINRFIVHNIHTAGCFGLFFLSRRMRVFTESSQWEELALAHLIKHADRSFFPDGGHLERCWGYGEHTLWRMVLAYEFARATGGMGERERHYVNRLRRAYQWYARTLAPGEISPAFGDDGIGPASQIIDRALTIFPEGTDRSLGVDRTKSYLMDASGFAIMRNGDADDSLYCTLTFGDYCGWHAHFDCLSMNLWRGGRPLLEELGRFGSYGGPLDHTFRAPEAHNQVLVDGHPYDNRIDDGALDVAWHSDARLDYFSAYHRAFREVASHRHRTYVASDDLLVRRTVVFVKDPGYVVVLDSVQHEHQRYFNRAISALWHAPEPFKALGPGLMRTGGRTGCLLAWAYPDGIQRMETSVSYTNEDSEGHGARHRLRVRRWEPLGHQGCLGFVTLLYSFEGKPPNVSISPLKTASGQRFRAEAMEIVTPAGEDVIVLNPERLDGFEYRRKPIEARWRFHRRRKSR